MEGYPGQGTMAAHSPGWDHALRDARLAVGSRGQRCDHRSPPRRKSVASTTRHFVRAIPLAAIRRISRRRTVRRPARLIPATAPYCLIDPPHYPVDHSAPFPITARPRPTDNSVVPRTDPNICRREPSRSALSDLLHVSRQIAIVRTLVLVGDAKGQQMTGHTGEAGANDACDNSAGDSRPSGPMKSSDPNTEIDGSVLGDDATAPLLPGLARSCGEQRVRRLVGRTGRSRSGRTERVRAGGGGRRQREGDVDARSHSDAAAQRVRQAVRRRRSHAAGCSPRSEELHHRRRRPEQCGDVRARGCRITRCGRSCCGAADLTGDGGDSECGRQRR